MRSILHISERIRLISSGWHICCASSWPAAKPLALVARDYLFRKIDVADAAGLSVVHVNRTIQTLRSLIVLSKANHLEVIDRKQPAKIA